MERRAFVTAFVADPALARALCARATEPGLVVRADRPGSRVDVNEEQGAINVTLRITRVNTGMRAWLTPHTVRRIPQGATARRYPRSPRPGR